MNEEKAKDFVTAIGAMTEMVSIFYKGLIDNGMSVQVAVLLTAEFIKIAFPHKQGG